MSVSLIEWKGGPPAPGELPAGARRIGRVAAVARPGQKSLVLLGLEKEESSVAARGFTLEVEPNLGANDQIIDLRLSLQGRGRVESSFAHGITLQRGAPILLPLGAVDGTSRGAVVEAGMVEGGGEHLP